MVMSDAVTMSAGSITGNRNRSCGKKIRPAANVAAAMSQSGAGLVPAVRARTAVRHRHAPPAANGSKSRYGAAEAILYLAECSAYEGPAGTTE
jgi:hypothetical protein